MCGIFGILSSSHSQITLPYLQNMGNAIVHRGPDDQGYWIVPEKGIALGHRRLSVIDPSPAGHQPMHSSCGRYVIIFNGEIYNHRIIRKEIESTQYFAEEVRVWRGQSDTEVILAAIGCWGFTATLARLVGMFALALWDEQEQALYIARDRMGEKPLYYGHMGSVFLFGSELKALRAHPAWQADIDRGALTLFLRYNYIPAPHSIYQDVYKLPPGKYLRVTREGKVRLDTYWSLPEVVSRVRVRPFTGSDEEAIHTLESHLLDAICGQMVADVPLGAFLSGGIDSSTVVALMQSQSRLPVRTFSIGFHEQEYDEARHARKVAEHLGTAHTELYVTASQARDVIPRLATLYDEPFSDSSQIPTFLVSQLARQHVTVSLSGDGGDEIFGGYHRYRIAGDAWKKTARIPLPLRKALAHVITGVRPKTWSALANCIHPILPGRLQHMNVGEKLHKMARILGLDGHDAIYRQLLSHWTEPARLVHDGYEPPCPLMQLPPDIHLNSLTERMMLLDAINYLPDDILVKVDRAAMGVSLETRVPMLDHRVIEFAWSLPLHMKIRNGEEKWILRQLLYRHVPPHLLERPKMGFGVPIGDWLRGPLRDWAEDLLAPAQMSSEGFFDPGPVQEKWQQHLRGTHNWQYLLWDVLMFQSWWKNTHA